MTESAPLFAAPDRRAPEKWPARIVAIAVVCLHDSSGQWCDTCIKSPSGIVGGCMIVRSGERVGETPIRCTVSGRFVVKSWLEAVESDYPSALDVQRARVTEGPEFDRAREVAEAELNRAVCAWFEVTI